MTVYDLQQILLKARPTDIVVIQISEDEASPLSMVSDTLTIYCPTNAWRGTIHPTDLTEELRVDGYREDDVRCDGVDGAVRAVVLLPTE